MKIPQPIRSLDASWSVSKDESEKSLFELEGFQMPPYPWQFVQNEMLLPVSSWNMNPFLNLFKVKINPIAINSLTGTIYVENKPIQVFIANEKTIDINPITDYSSGKVYEIGETFVEKINIIHMLGNLEFTWNKFPGHNHIVVNYEYEHCNSIEHY